METVTWKVERIDGGNYSCFADLVYWREQGCERPPAEKADVPQALGDPDLYVYAAEAEGRFVGWISLVCIPKISKWKRGHIYVDELWVQPEYRRRGIARALMDKAVQLREARNADGIRLYVNVENPGARALYARCGYRENGQAYFMEK